MKTLIIFIAFFLYSLSAYAFRVTPMTAEFDAKGRGATQTFQVDNNSEKEVALEVEVLTRKIDVDNKELREKTKDFMVYPVQLSIKAGEKKNIRLSYVGAELDNETAFRLIVRQLPVNLDKKKNEGRVQSQINFLFEYVASLYVRAKTAPVPKLELQEYKREGKVANLTLKNTGNSHILFKSYNIVVSDGKEKAELNLSNKEFESIASYNFLSGEVRKVALPLPATVKGAELSFEFKVRELY